MKYIIANFKLSKNTTEEITNWLKIVSQYSSQKTKLIVAPQVAFLELTSETLATASQDISIFETGAHTGATSIESIKAFCKYCIIGHSETKPKNEETLIKRDLCLKNKITPIICFETLEQAQTFDHQDALLAWEDHNNISQNGVYKNTNIDQISSNIKEITTKLQFSKKIIYGGSVNRQNVENLANIQDISGVLVGHASLDPEHFLDIAKAFDK